LVGGGAGALSTAQPSRWDNTGRKIEDKYKTLVGYSLGPLGLAR